MCLHIPPSSTHLWLRCSNFFNPSKKNSFDCVADRKMGKAKDLPAHLRNLKEVVGSSCEYVDGSLDVWAPVRHPLEQWVCWKLVRVNTYLQWSISLQCNIWCSTPSPSSTAKESITVCENFGLCANIILRWENGQNNGHFIGHQVHPLT
jgi:hypothetical protein